MSDNMLQANTPRDTDSEYIKKARLAGVGVFEQAGAPAPAAGDRQKNIDGCRDTLYREPHHCGGPGDSYSYIYDTRTSEMMIYQSSRMVMYVPTTAISSDNALAMLKLAAEELGPARVTGSTFFVQKMVEMADKHGFELANYPEELEQIRDKNQARLGADMYTRPAPRLDPIEGVLTLSYAADGKTQMEIKQDMVTRRVQADSAHISAEHAASLQGKPVRYEPPYRGKPAQVVDTRIEARKKAELVYPQMTGRLVGYSADVDENGKRELTIVQAGVAGIVKIDGDQFDVQQAKLLMNQPVRYEPARNGNPARVVDTVLERGKNHRKMLAI